MKRCAKCGEVKQSTDFYLRPGSPDGLRNDCKACRREASRRWLTENEQRAQCSRATWRAVNRPAVLQDQRERYRANPQRYKCQAREWNAEARRSLHDSYVRRMLPPSASPELMNMKREQLGLHRLAKQLKQAISERNEDGER